MTKLAAYALLTGPLVLGTGNAVCQDYPNKLIRIVTSEPGTANDMVSRLLADSLPASMGQPVIVDNRNLAIAPAFTAKAPPDGYTVLFHGPPVWILPLLRSTATWDAARDLAPITLATMTPNILAVHPSVPAKSVSELISLAKGRPGELNFASAGPGSSNHLAGELFKFMTAINVVHVPYKGAGAALTGLVGGQVHFMLPTAGSGMPHVKSGRLRALAVTSARASALAAGLPTVAASGVPGYESTAMLGLFAPAKTPVAAIARLNREVASILNKAEMKERLLGTGLEVVAGSPEDFGAAVKLEILRLGKVIRESRIRED